MTTERGANLPASAQSPNNSLVILNSRLILIASAKVLTEALQLPDLAAREIAARLSMFGPLGYFVSPMIQEQRRALIITFVGALEGVPSPFSAGSFDEWFNRMSRTPTPGDIGNGARSLMHRARARLKYLQPAPMRISPRDADFTPEEIDRRRAFSRQMARQYPDLIKGDDSNG